MSFTIRSLLISVLFSPLAALAADIPEPVERAASQIAPGFTPDSIAPAPIAGFYQVMYGANLVYLSEDGRYLIDGDVIDLQQRQNLSEQARGSGRLAALEKVGEDSMIVFGPKDAKHTITVFTDIDCTFCRRLHGGMEEMNELGIRVRYLAFPRAGIDSPSYNKAVSVWCAEDPKAAMDKAKSGADPDPAQCDDAPVKRHLALGQAMGVSATPTLILDDGQVVRGYVPPKRLLGILEGNASAQ